MRKSGDDLLSQGGYPQVPSALAVFTSVFGMGTGVSPPLWPPEISDGATRPASTRVSLEHSIVSTNNENPKPSAD